MVLHADEFKKEHIENQNFLKEIKKKNQDFLSDGFVMHKITVFDCNLNI
jgi:hypothetical protein